MRALVATVAASLFIAPGALAASGTATFFETPSKNIVCVYIAATPGISAALQCGVGSGLHPPAPKPPGGCTVTDPASNRVELDAIGRTHGFCSGDTGVLAELGKAPVLPYGTSFRRGGFVCSSATTGLTCKNTSGHGFFLSRQSWHAF